MFSYTINIDLMFNPPAPNILKHMYNVYSVTKFAYDAERVNSFVILSRDIFQLLSYTPLTNYKQIFPGYFSLVLLIFTDQLESGFHNTGNKIFQRVLIWTLPVE